MTKLGWKRFLRQLDMATLPLTLLDRGLRGVRIVATELEAPDDVMAALKNARSAVKRLRQSLALAYDRLAAVPLTERERAPKQKQPKSLFHFLAWDGGLRPDPELRAIFGGLNPFVPRYGKLIRKTGMSLDAAREACIEEGFLEDCENPAPSISDLLELLAEEARGHKQYRIHEVIDAWEWSRAEARSNLEARGLR